MAFEFAHDFSVLRYATPDSIDDILAANYFGAAYEGLKVGDVIISKSSISTSPRIHYLIVTAHAYNMVTVKEITHTLSTEDVQTVLLAKSLSLSDLVIDSSAAGYSPATDAADLAIIGAGNRGLSVVTDDAGTAWVTFGDATNVAQGWVKYDNSTDSLALGTNGQDRLTLDGSGGLQLSGDVTLAGSSSFYKADNTQVTVVSGGDSVSTGGNVQLFGGSHGSRPDQLVLRNGTTEAVALDQNSNLTFSNGSHSLAVQYDSGGYFLTAPQHRLVIGGTTQFAINGAGEASFASNVGVGGGATAEALTVTGAVYATGSAADFANVGTHLDYQTGAARLNAYNDGGEGAIFFFTNANGQASAKVMEVRGSGNAYLAGNLGIGEPNPTHPVHVTASGTDSAIRLNESTSGSDTFFGHYDTSGNVGLDVNGTGASFRITTGAQTRLSIDNAGKVTLAQAAELQGGAYLGGNTAANLLNHYEEGDWTPELTDGTNTPTSYWFRHGRYTRIGRMVHIEMSLSVQDKGALSGGLKITGLPYTASNTGSLNRPLAAHFFAGIDGEGYIQAGMNEILLKVSNSDTDIAATDVVAGTQIHLSGSFSL